MEPKFTMTIKLKHHRDAAVFPKCTKQMITDVLKAQPFETIESIDIIEDEESVRNELRELRYKMHQEQEEKSK
jgi:hypothetical protein